MRTILIIVSLLFWSCSSFLDVEPRRYMDVDDVFESKENFHAAMIGCYDALQGEWYYGRTLLMIGDLASDVSFADGTKVELKEIDDNAILADNIAINGLWRQAYEGINRINYLLHFIDEVPQLDTSLKKDYTGQLRFLRGFHYFNLVRLFGDVPLVLSPTLSDEEENFQPRTSRTLIYETIVTDLEFADENIENTDPEYATSLASKTLLASTYLTLGEYQKAYELANGVLSEKNFLEPVYASIYNNVEISNEIIFYIPFSSEDKNRLAEYHYPRQLGGRHENAPSELFMGQLDERDRRYNLVAKNYDDQYYCNKYFHLSTGADIIIVYRTAELYYIRAEALLHMEGMLQGNQVLNDINTLRLRSGLNALSAGSLEELFDLLYREKMIEFAFEGKRWFDLIRTGRAIDKVPTVTRETQMLFPIPINEITANPFISENDQNEGY